MFLESTNQNFPGERLPDRPCYNPPPPPPQIKAIFRCYVRKHVETTVYNKFLLFRYIFITSIHIPYDKQFL